MHNIQYISQGSTPEAHIANCAEVLQAGGKWIQLRLKGYSDEVVTQTAREVQKLCQTFEATFIVNDYYKIAHEIDADGIHLGLTDTSIEEARKLLGNAKIIGGTANTLAHVKQRIAEGCDYVGLGPFRFTTTKDKLSPILGLEGYESIIFQLTEKERETPIVAIGGIEMDDISALREVGIAGVALSGLITRSNDKKELMKRIKIKLYEHA